MVSATAALKPKVSFALSGKADIFEGRLVAADATFIRWLSKAGSRAVGGLIGETLPSLLADSVRDLISAGTTSSLILNPGAAFPAALKIELISRGRGAYSLACYDVADLHNAVVALEHSQQMTERESERLQLLLQASVAFAAAMTLEELGPLVVEAARRSFRASAVSLHVLEDGQYRMLAGENPLLPYWPTQAPEPGARTVQLGRVVQITSPEQAEEVLPGIGASFRHAGVRATIVAPIIEQDAPIGALACYFTHERRFDEQAEPLARALAQQAAQAFVRLRLGAELRRRVMHDEITGLPNRRLFEEQIEQTLLGSEKAVAVVFIDLDRFKAVNDELGHAFGDRLLAEVGQRLRKVFRQDDMVARYGGDEFIAICEVTSQADASRIAERIRTAIEQPFEGLPPRLHVTASIGLVLSTSFDTRLIESLLRLADKAMYTAKAAGGNRIHYVHD